MLQVVQWAFSFSLYGRRRFIQAWQRRQPELCTQTKEAGAEIQDVGSRIQTFSSKKDEKWGIGAIWLPGSPGTPGLARSRTGTAPRTSTDNEDIISMNFQSCSYFSKFRSYLVIKCSNLVPGVLFLQLLSVKGNIYIYLTVTKSRVQSKTNNYLILPKQHFCRVHQITFRIFSYNIESVIPVSWSYQP